MPVESSSPAKRRSIREHFAAELEESWTDAVLVGSNFITGLLDSAVYNVWNCFVSMQTGNTIYVGLGVSGQPTSQPYRWSKSLLSIASFMLGAYLFSRVSRWLGPLRRGTMVLSWFVQALLCAVSAILVQIGIVPQNAGDLVPKNCIVLLPLGLLAAQAGAQMCVSRLLAFSEVPTTVLTSVYCDLVFDPQAFTAPLNQNVKRNRRALSVVLLVAGAIVGGFMTKGGAIEWSLWLATALKLAIVVVWCFWKPKGRIQLE